jgi:peptidoglycan/xylan/chitin deacetylase (PgdA/CDA1 family)
MKQKYKNLHYAILTSSGFYWLWRCFCHDSIVFMTIHGVMDIEDDALWIPTRPRISTKQLDITLGLIGKYYNFISIDEAVSMLSGDIPFRQHCVVITFDDGYRNSFTHAWPVLCKHNAPGILFPAVGHVESRKCFWFDRLDYAIQQHVSNGGEYCELAGEKIPLDKTDRKTLQASVKSVILKVKELPGNDIDVMSATEKAISKLEEASGKSLNDIVESDPWSGVISWDDLRLASEKGMDIGSHTVDHARIGLLSEQAAKWQLKESKRMIEENLNKSCNYFCYPNGNYTQETIPLVKEAGYEAALTTKEGDNKPGVDLYQIKRVHMPQGRTPQEGLAVASGFGFKLSTLINRLRGTSVAQTK